MDRQRKHSPLSQPNKLVDSEQSSPSNLPLQHPELTINPEETRTAAKEFELQIVPAKVARFLGFFILGLVMAGLIGQFCKHILGYEYLKGLVPLFNLDGESNIPAYSSALMLLLSSVLLGAIAFHHYHRGDRFRRQWKYLSFIFLYLSVDEATSIHELTVYPLRNALNAGGVLYYTWVIVGAIAVLVFLAAFRKFLLHLPCATRTLFMIAGTVFVAGALGIEMLGAWQVDTFGGDNFTYALTAIVEETLEMTGVAVFIYALLSYMHRAKMLTKISV